MRLARASEQASQTSGGGFAGLLQGMNVGQLSDGKTTMRSCMNAFGFTENKYAFQVVRELVMKTIGLLFLLPLFYCWPSSFACSSFDCSFGGCVKAYKMRGQCMKAVNEYGVKTYQRPRTGSVYSGDSQGQCRFNTDCPIGFKCDRSLKACVK